MSGYEPPPGSPFQKVVPAGTPLPPKRTYPPRPDGLPYGIKRGRPEIELLRNDAFAEMQMGSWDDSLQALAEGRRRVTFPTNNPGLAAEGVWQCCRWLLGDTNRGPMTGDESDYPRSRDAVGREENRARDVVERPRAFREILRFEIAEGFLEAMTWARGNPDDPDDARYRPRPIKRG